MAKGKDKTSVGAAGPSQWRKADQWLPGVFFWSFQVALTSAAFALTNRTATREGSLGRSLITWGVWALLAPLIVGLDRWLPLSREAIFKRFVLHLPFSLVFTALNLIDKETTLCCTREPGHFRCPRTFWRGLSRAGFSSTGCCC